MSYEIVEIVFVENKLSSTFSKKLEDLLDGYSEFLIVDKYPSGYKLYVKEGYFKFLYEKLGSLGPDLIENTNVGNNKLLVLSTGSLKTLDNVSNKMSKLF